MEKFDPKKVKKVKIIATDSDGKQWEIESIGSPLTEYLISELQYMHYFYFDSEPRYMKITGPYSAAPDHVKIAGVPLKE